MRVNIYAEEITDRVEIVEKHTDEGSFTGVRFYLELPVTLGTGQAQGPFMHRPGDDDSAAVTFWGKRELRRALIKALALLDRHEHPMKAMPDVFTAQAQAAADCKSGFAERGDGALRPAHRGVQSPYAQP